MNDTNEYRRVLAIDGPFRKWLKDVGGNSGNWADDFCDGLLLRLPHIEQSIKIHLWASRNGEFQINIDDGNSGAYTNDVSSDPLKVIGERLERKTELVCDTDADEAGTDCEDEVDSAGVRGILPSVSEARTEGQGSLDFTPVLGLLVHEV